MTAEEIAEVKLKIKQAERARHNLITGAAARVFVDQNGERVEYFKANLSDLSKYIADLKASLPGAAPIKYARPMRFNFL